MSRVGVVTFPGSLDDHDALRAVRIAGAVPVALWHASDRLAGVDAVILPGGFSYGDYLRCGAIARFAPIMAGVIAAANAGMPVLGICNGFQVLCESHLLDGAMIRNAGRRFVCRQQRLRVESADTTWTCEYTAGQEITIVLKNGEGNFQADPETLHRLTVVKRLFESDKPNTRPRAGSSAAVEPTEKRALVAPGTPRCSAIAQRSHS